MNICMSCYEDMGKHTEICPNCGAQHTTCPIHNTRYLTPEDGVGGCPDCEDEDHEDNDELASDEEGAIRDIWEGGPRNYGDCGDAEDSDELMEA